MVVRLNSNKKIKFSFSVVKATVFLTDTSEWPAFDEVYSKRKLWRLYFVK